MPDALAPAGVVFDFNGTLSDDEHLLQEIFAALFADHLGFRLTPEDYRSNFVGLSDRAIIEKALARTGQDGDMELLLTERHDHYRQRVAEQSPVRESTRALVRGLASSGRRLAIVTGAQRPDVEVVLAAVPEASLFEAIITEEDVDRGKPDPEGVLRAAAALDLDPGQLLVLEDSVAGVRAGLAAGARVLAVAGSQDPGQLRAEGVEVVSALEPGLLDRPPFAG